MSLKRRGYREVGGCITIENVDQLRFFHCANHGGSAFGVGCEVLARNDPSRTRLSICFLMQLDETARVRVIFKDDDAARVRADDCVVCGRKWVSYFHFREYRCAPFVPPVNLKAAKELGMTTIRKSRHVTSPRSPLVPLNVGPCIDTR